MDLNLKSRTYKLDDETLDLLRNYAQMRKTTMSTALRLLINEHCKPHRVTSNLGG